MVDATSVECSVKVRYGKKWKQRYCLLKKLSPIADCIHVFLQKDPSALIRRSSIIGSFNKQGPSSDYQIATLSLEDFCGIECDFELDREKHVMSLICRKQVLTFAFHNQQTLEAWKGFVRRHLGDEYRYEAQLVKAPSSLEVSGSVTLVSVFIRGRLLCITTRGGVGSIPPVHLASWNICDLRRFGLQNGLFCFDACNCDTAGVFALSSSDANEIDARLKGASDIPRVGPGSGETLRRGLSGSDRSLPEFILRDSLNRSLVGASGYSGTRVGSASTAGSLSSRVRGSAMPLAELNRSSSSRYAAPYYNVITGSQSPAVRTLTNVTRYDATKAIQSPVVHDDYSNLSTFQSYLRSCDALQYEKTEDASYYNVVPVKRANGLTVPPELKPKHPYFVPVASVIQAKQSGEKRTIIRRRSFAGLPNSSSNNLRYKRRAYSCSCLSNVRIKPGDGKSNAVEYVNLDDVVKENVDNANSSQSRDGLNCYNTAKLMSSDKFKSCNGADGGPPPLMRTLVKKPVEADEALPYYDLGRFDGDNCDDGYLYLRSVDYVSQQTSDTEAGTTKSRNEKLTHRSDSAKPFVPHRLATLENSLLNCVPPAPPIANRNLTSPRSIKSCMLPAPVSRRINNIECDEPVLCSVEFPAVTPRDMKSGYRAMSVSNQRGVVSQQVLLNEPDYLDMSRDRLLEMQQRAMSSSQNSNSDYLPMGIVDQSKTIAGNSSKKSNRLIKSHSADGLVDQMDSESGSDVTLVSAKAPDLITRIFGNRNRSSATVSSDLSDEIHQSLLCSSTNSLTTDALVDSSELLQSPTYYPEEHIAAELYSDKERCRVEERSSKLVERVQEPPPLPEKQRSLCSALSIVPPVPPRAGVDAGSTLAAAAVQPKASRKPDLTVNIPQAGSEIAMNSHEVPLSNFRPDMYLSAHGKLDSPSLSTSMSTRSRRSIQSELLTTVPPSQRTTSHATTTLRPRYGKEYHRIDRNRLVSSGDSSPLFTSTPPSRSPMSAVSRNQSSVFNFDTVPRSLATMCGSHIGSDDNSPKYPANVVHPYVNLDSTPPIVLDAILGPAANDRSNSDSAMVNYTDLDLATPSLLESVPIMKTSRNMRVNDTQTEYAQIDLVATAAASQASRMHTRDRQDALERCAERLDRTNATATAELKQPFSRKGSAVVVPSQSFRRQLKGDWQVWSQSAPPV